MRWLRLIWQGPFRGTRRRPTPVWLRRGLFAAAVLAVFAVYLGVVMQATRSGWIGAQLDDFHAQIETRAADAGFRVASIQAYGANQTEATELREALAVTPGAPMLSLDLMTLREKVQRLPWVHAASVERVLPDRLVVRVLEREPMALLQQDRRLTLIDADGETIPNAPLTPFVELPTVTGAGAAEAGPALFEMLRTQPALAARVTGATRMGMRRWDLRIDDRVWVRLPEKKADAAWRRLAEIDARHRILRRNVRAVDIRNPEQWAFRLPPGMRLRMAIQNNGS